MPSPHVCIERTRRGEAPGHDADRLLAELARLIAQADTDELSNNERAFLVDLETRLKAAAARATSDVESQADLEWTMNLCDYWIDQRAERRQPPISNEPPISSWKHILVEGLVRLARRLGGLRGPRYRESGDHPAIRSLMRLWWYC